MKLKNLLFIVVNLISIVCLGQINSDSLNNCKETLSCKEIDFLLNRNIDAINFENQFNITNSKLILEQSKVKNLEINSKIDLEIINSKNLKLNEYYLSNQNLIKRNIVLEKRINGKNTLLIISFSIIVVTIPILYTIK